MSTGEQLIERVVKTVQDPSIDTDDILELLNEGLMIIASRVLLPDLETADTVDTVVDEIEVPLPSDYHRGLYDCQEQDPYNPVVVLNSKRQMLATYGKLNYTGTVKHVCRVGFDLLYQPMPDEVRTLTISYYRMPTQLTESETPEGLPVQFHRALFHYATFQLFDDIEDGMEGQKVNTARHEGKFEALVAEIELFFRDSQSRPKPPIVRGEFL